MPMMGRNGFTLLELLVALTIFAFLGITAYSGLDTVLNVRTRLADQAEALAAVQRAFDTLQRDLDQALPRPVRDGFGDTQPALSGGVEATGELRFTRGGWPNPADLRRSQVVRIAYGVNADGEWLRNVWRRPDRASNEPDLARRLLAEVDSVDFQFYTDAGRWQEDWPPIGGSPVALPRAVEVTVEHPRWGALRRVFRIGPMRPPGSDPLGQPTRGEPTGGRSR
jgi:general secretion pathway protein J